MRVVDPKATEPVKHDHIDILFGDLAVRYHDPRRFGFLIWLPESQDPHDLPEIAKLGEEPFFGWLYCGPAAFRFSKYFAAD